MTEHAFKTYKKPDGFDQREARMTPLYPMTGEDMPKKTNARPEGSGSPRMEICLYCSNKSRDVCSPCADEAKYRYLVPTMLENWENFDHLVMRNLVDWDASSRLAALYLLAWYR